MPYNRFFRSNSYLHPEIGNPSAQIMIAKLELFQHKPEINIGEI